MRFAGQGLVAQPKWDTNPVMDEIQDASVPFPTFDDGIEGNWEEGQKYIYESPDGGKTIYRRKFGEYDDRTSVRKNT